MNTPFLKVVFLFFLLGCGCFKKQDNPINPPDWPRYKFGGIVLDSLTNDPIYNCIVTIKAFILIYRDDDFISAKDTTDSSGIFLFNSIPPGVHQVNFEKEAYYPSTDNLMIHHRDSLNYRVSLLRISDAPNILLFPTSFSVTVRVGGGANRTLLLSNTGDGVHLDWSIQESPSVDWLSVSPESGSVPPHHGQNVYLRFDASNMSESGIYITNLIINSNDPDKPIVYVYVEFTVIG